MWCYDIFLSRLCHQSSVSLWIDSHMSAMYKKLTIARKKLFFYSSLLVLSTFEDRKQHQKVSCSMFLLFGDKHISFPRRRQNNSGRILAFYFLTYQYNETRVPSQKQTKLIHNEHNLEYLQMRSNGNYINCQEFDGSLNDEANLVWFVNKILIILQSDGD